MLVRHSSSSSIEVPEHMRPLKEDLGDGPMETPAGQLDPNSPPENVRKELWQLYVATLRRVDQNAAHPPRRRVLHWILLNANSKAELDMALTLTEHWRRNMFPITQATTHIWAQACIRINYPEPFIAMLMDRWKYRQLPVVQTVVVFTRYLGAQAAAAYAQSTGAGDEMAARGDQLLDDVFRVFGLLPYYDVPCGPAIYGALVEACCAVNTEEAWRRALIASEEALAVNPPNLTRDALQALEARSRGRGETEMADRYQSIGARLEVKPAPATSVEFDKKGNEVPQKPEDGHHR
ncbi:hypothetical protein H4R21_001423 [Coemansia helicoidea]|uniref:Uncharacterized protein n=1 Tax=Coemansia helicoidea TaxID=1286919 RepID=A0ACC1LBT8_9FUNG|nr:hypothetical protein H4R21_001423 [Coemansia helicoidea]